MPTKDQITEVLKTVEDPEIKMDIITLELIYNIEIQGEKVKILMTFTSPACPYGPWLLELIKQKIMETFPQIKDVNIDVTFNPPWNPSADLRAIIGI